MRCLLREQFPDWADQPVRPVEVDGWDNRTFRVREGLSARPPSADGYAAAVDKEQRRLPVLRPQLPSSVPQPLGRGEPVAGGDPQGSRGWAGVRRRR